MLERTEMRFGMRSASLAADSAYRSAESLAWLVKHKGIVPRAGKGQPDAVVLPPVEPPCQRIVV